MENKLLGKNETSPPMEGRSFPGRFGFFPASFIHAHGRARYSEARNKGQALIPILIIILIVLTLGAGTLYLNVGGVLVSSCSQEGERVLLATEGAIENGLLRMLRNPSYSGESLQIGGVPCTISLSGQAPILMTAECVSDRAVRRIQAEVSFVQGEMIIDNYQEIE